jgi:hypothetical protein
MLRLVAEAFDAMLDEIRQTLPRQVAVRYGEHLCEAIGRRLEEITAEARESISLRETQLKQARAVLGRLDALAETSASARSALERIERDLSARLDENEPDEDPHRDEAEE